MDEDNNAMRHFNSKSTAFQNEKGGKIIKSSRKFGIEVEMFNQDADALTVLAKKLPKDFGLEHDGSIEGSGYPIEVVTPVLQGEAGETAVVGMFKDINALKYKVNRTCGLHVHLDGKGFSQGNDVRYVRVDSSDVKQILEELSDKDGDYAFVVKRDVIKRMSNKIDTGDAIRLIADEYLAIDGDELFLSKELRENIPTIQKTETLVSAGDTTAMLDLFSFVHEGAVPEEDEISVGEDRAASDDLLCVVYGNRNLRNILTLLYLHTVYSDVFMSMLPKSRRQDNLYCQSLSLAFSAGQIENIRSFTELEAAWYKTRSINDARRRKGNHYDDSRYFTLNLHSLFAKYGTIEIRSHSGTTDHNKALYWVAFHQEILDRIVSGHLTIDMLRPGSYLSDIDEKTRYLKDVLGLRSSLRAYMQKRIDYFKTSETK